MIPAIFVRRMRSAGRAAGWLKICGLTLVGCAGVSGCVSDELIKVVLAQNVALTAASVVQSLLSGLLVTA
jgi:hypothetical protein